MEASAGEKKRAGYGTGRAARYTTGMSSDEQKRAVILLSGGLDSATTLGIAAREGYGCYALSFDYGQRHQREVSAAAALPRSSPS